MTRRETLSVAIEVRCIAEVGISQLKCYNPPPTPPPPTHTHKDSPIWVHLNISNVYVSRVIATHPLSYQMGKVLCSAFT